MSNSLLSMFQFLRKNKTFTTINIFGLAFGFTCALLIFMHVHKEKTYNSAIPESERVFYLLQKSPETPLGNTSISYALPPLLANNFPEIEYYARTENYSLFSNCIFTLNDASVNKPFSFNEHDFYLADNNLFQIIQYRFIEGLPENALIEPNSIVLSSVTAKKYFGNQPALGKTLILNNEKLFKITGVVEIPEYVTFSFSLLAPISSLRSASKLEGWDSNGQPLFKLQKQVKYQDFNKRIEKFYSEFKPVDIHNPERIRLSLLPAKERRLYYNKNPLYLLIFIGLVVLTVSILNYVNLTTSMVQKRTAEIALKKISGAGQKTIAIQFMRETAIIAFFSIVLGIILSFIGLPLFKQLTGSNLQPFMENHLGIFIIGSIILLLVVTLAAGFYPSMVLSGVKPLTLFNKGKKSIFNIQSKSVLITTQFVISIVLLIITSMVTRQYNYMNQMPLGFNNELVMQIPFTNNLKENYPKLKDELNKNPLIKNLCAASSMPAGIPNHSTVNWVDDNGENHEESFCFAIVSDGYTQTFEMQLIQGNPFTSQQPEELKGVILNETAVKQLGYNNPVGKQIHFWGKQNTIIGIVKDFQNNYLFNKVKPMVMSAHPNNQEFTKFLFISISPGNINGTIANIEKTIKSFSPDFPFEYRFTTSEAQEFINEIKEINHTFRFASAVSILLAIVGLLALTYHATQSRIKEIGIRKVNGAKSIEIIRLLNSTFLRNIFIAYLIACPIAWLIISYLLKGIGNKTNIAWWIFALSGFAVGAIALLTVSFQSYNAATRNPVEALRYE